MRSVLCWNYGVMSCCRAREQLARNYSPGQVAAAMRLLKRTGWLASCLVGDGRRTDECKNPRSFTKRSEPLPSSCFRCLARF